VTVELVSSVSTNIEFVEKLQRQLTRLASHLVRAPAGAGARAGESNLDVGTDSLVLYV
jgi:hypothetical protein